MTFENYLKSRKITVLDVIMVVCGGALCVALLSFALGPDASLPEPAPVIVEVTYPNAGPPVARSLPPETPSSGSNLVMFSNSPPAWFANLPDFKAWAAGASYYGAFAVSENRQFSWVTEYNDPETAAAMARAYCARKSGQPCQVVAQLEPVTPIGDGEVPMSELTARLFAENNARDGFRDFALAEDGTYGLAWGYPTHHEARQAAMARCEAKLRDRAEGLPRVSCRLVEWRIRDIQQGR